MLKQIIQQINKIMKKVLFFKIVSTYYIQIMPIKAVSDHMKNL